MSQKNLDKKNRWRSKTVAFRVSPEEYEQIESLARISGQTKQAYLIDRALQRDIVVKGSPRTYKMLREQMVKLLNQFENSEITKENLDETAVIIQQINTTLYGFKNND